MRTSRTDSSVSAVPPSRRSKSAGLRSSTTRPRASVAMRSIVTRRPGPSVDTDAAAISTANAACIARLKGSRSMRARLKGSCSMRAAYVARLTGSRAIQLAGHTEAEELLRVAVLIARLDLEDVFARRQGRKRHFDLLFARLRRRRGLQLAHRAAGTVEDMHLERGRGAGRPVGRHADQQALGSIEFPHRN